MEWFTEHDWQSWLGLSAVLAILELLGMEFFLLMASVGALSGMLAALVGLPGYAQVLVAAATTLAMLVFVRPTIVKRLHGGPELTLGTDKLIGRPAVVTVAPTTDVPGRVRLDGEEWTALPYDEHLTLAEGQSVEVLEIRGATAYVHPVAELD